MKKYRYSTRRTLFGKVAPLVYFIGTWNLLGYVLYRKMSKDLEQKFPDYEKLSSRQKALIWFGYGKENVEVRRIVVENFSVKEDKVVTGKELVTYRKQERSNDSS